VYTKRNTETTNIPKKFFFWNSWKNLVTLSATVILGIELHCGLFIYLFTRDQILLGIESDHCIE